MCRGEKGARGTRLGPRQFSLAATARRCAGGWEWPQETTFVEDLLIGKLLTMRDRRWEPRVSLGLQGDWCRSRRRSNGAGSPGWPSLGGCVGTAAMAMGTAACSKKRSLGREVSRRDGMRTWLLADERSQPNRDRRAGLGSHGW